MEKQAPNKKDALDVLWRRGKLKFKLDPIQKEMYDLYYTSEFKTFVWLLSRRSGKSYCLVILAIEQCIRQKNSIVKFIAPTKLQVNNIIRPIFRKILDDCPEDLKPEYNRTMYTYFFPNGSEIQLAGTDSGHAEKIRGGDSHLWVIDEAGSCQDLDNVVKSILLPTTLITKGKGILASTPPKEPDHDFLGYIEEAEIKGTLTKKTIDDNPRVSQKDKEDLIAELGGMDSEETRRELYCEIIKSANLSVFPEFDKDLEAKIIRDWPRAPFYDSYTSMDVGFNDLTALLFGYYDFRASKLIIEDEITVKGYNLKLPDLARDVLQKEHDLWLNELTNEPRAVYYRVSDIDKIVISELGHHSKGKLIFSEAKKDDNDAAINNLRVLLTAGKIIINPRCKHLINHLRYVRWYSEKDHTKFARSPKDERGDQHHYDCVESLKYLVRHVDYSKNPYPAHYSIPNFNINEPYHIQRNTNNNMSDSAIDVYKKIFNTKRKK
jgi:hypothetical protein